MEAFKVGMNITEACAYAKISRVTYYDWMSRIDGFAYIIEGAKDLFMAVLKKKVMSGALKDPKLAFEIVRRRDASYVERVEDT